MSVRVRCASFIIIFPSTGGRGPLGCCKRSRKQIIIFRKKKKKRRYLEIQTFIRIVLNMNIRVYEFVRQHLLNYIDLNYQNLYICCSPPKSYRLYTRKKIYIYRRSSPTVLRLPPAQSYCYTVIINFFFFETFLADLADLFSLTSNFSWYCFPQGPNTACTEEPPARQQTQDTSQYYRNANRPSTVKDCYKEVSSLNKNTQILIYTCWFRESI